ncbi:hypothetical protein BDW22DRAFT_676865 [Trametopsis cervina]|nr:hypothetical protein BDW22DRAFT_676865 [Trametopsis cervina]
MDASLSSPPLTSTVRTSHPPLTRPPRAVLPPLHSQNPMPSHAFFQPSTEAICIRCPPIVPTHPLTRSRWWINGWLAEELGYHIHTLPTYRLFVCRHYVSGPSCQTETETGRSQPTNQPLASLFLSNAEQNAVLYDTPRFSPAPANHRLVRYLT